MAWLSKVFGRSFDPGNPAVGLARWSGGSRRVVAHALAMGGPLSVARAGGLPLYDALIRWNLSFGRAVDLCAVATVRCACAGLDVIAAC